MVDWDKLYIRPAGIVKMSPGHFRLKNLQSHSASAVWANETKRVEFNYVTIPCTNDYFPYIRGKGPRLSKGQQLMIYLIIAPWRLEVATHVENRQRELHMSCPKVP
jgi:hypothetical protein